MPSEDPLARARTSSRSISLPAVLGAGLALAYPFAVYGGLSRVRTRPLGVSLAVLVLLGLLLRTRGEKREHALVIARVPLSMVALLLFGSLFDDPRFVLALPVLTNVILLAQFAGSLRTVPLVERFARAKEADPLSPARVAYCRRVTLVWCAFFVGNGTITAALALCAPIAWWTAYAGGVSYALVGLVMAGEYVVRKRTFRTYGTGSLDRLLAHFFPPRQKLAEDVPPGA